MFSRLFGSGKKKSAADAYFGDDVKNWSFLGTDMHSHLVPGIDDGAQTIEDSIELIEKLQGMGYKSLITTPHIKSDHYPNTTVTINDGLESLRKALHEKGINMPIRAAAEYYIDEHFLKLLRNKELLTVHNNEVLVEISFLFEPIRFHEILFEILTAGYKPILAHPERYSFYHAKPEVYKELKDKGCLLQLNYIALSGYYGRPVKQVAEYLLKENLYDYCGTDMHHIKHAESIEKMLDSSSYNLLRGYNFKNGNLHAGLLS